MNGTSHRTRRTIQTLVVTAAIAALAAPAASAGTGGPGFVPSKLGSPDPRESQGNVSSAGLVPTKLGSQDPRDTAAQSVSQSSIVARQLGSQDPRDAASQAIAESSVVASELGTPDTRDAVAQSNDGDFMFRDYSRGTHYVAQPDWLRALEIRGEGMNKQYASKQPAWLRALEIRGEGMNKLYSGGKQGPVGTVATSSGDGFDVGNLEIGIVGAVCGLLLITALGIGARQVRHTRHGLGSA